MIQEIRKQRGLSQSQLAEKIGMSVRMLQHYEQGYKNIDHAKLDTICNIARALECSIEDILVSPELKAKLRETKRN